MSPVWRPDPPNPDLRAELERRFFAKVDIGDCWLWTASTDSGGYGKFWVSDGEGGGTIVGAHRFAYELMVARLPKRDEDGGRIHVDHLCRVRLCVNPDHLEAVPERENYLRGVSPPAKNAAKSHCSRGHFYTDENTWVSVEGKRQCRECWPIQKRERQEAAA